MRAVRIDWRIVAVLALAVLVFCAAPFFERSAQAAIKVLVSSGAASPDGNGTLSLFKPPALNDLGQLAFVADLAGTSGGAADNQALYRYAPAGLALIAREGQSVNGKTVSMLPSASIDGGGVVAGQLVLTPNPATYATVLGSGGAVTKLVEPGSASPSGNNSLTEVANYAVVDSGQASLLASYGGANAETGIYTRAPNGTLTTRVLKGVPAPRGGTINGFSNRLTMNESGMVANILKIDAVSFDSLARIDGTTVHELARAGDLTLDGVTKIGAFTSSDSALATPIPMINNAGQIAVTAKYGVANRIGAFRLDNSGIRLIAPNDMIGSGTGVAKMNVIGLDDNGQAALWAEFDGSGDVGSGIYLANAVNHSPIALEDLLSPTPGKYFRSFFTAGAALNDVGELVFLAELSNTANGAAAGFGLYHYDADAGLREIVSTGDLVDGSAITSLTFNGTLNAAFSQSPDRSIGGLNNRRQVAFAMSLANGQDKIGLWTSLDGDFNFDGKVDAADYTVWRDGLGGEFDLEDYQLWKDNFGQPSGSGGGAVTTTMAAAIPEPSSLLLVLFLAVSVLATIRSQRVLSGRSECDFRF